jgi:hypothetical protein
MWSSSCGPANPNSRRSVSLKHSLKTLWIEELPDPGVLAVSNFIFGSDREESTFVKHRDTVGDTEGTWQVMGYDDHCHLEGPLEKQNQLIQFRRNYRIETGGRFIKNQDFGIQCESTRNGGPLFHAAGQLLRVQVAKLRETNHGQFHPDHEVDDGWNESGVLPQSKCNIIFYRKGVK